MRERTCGIMKKHVLTALLLGCAVAVAGCSGSKKETEAPKTAETAATRETEAKVKETEAATAPAAETEVAAPAAETEAAAPVAETEAAAPAAETEATTAPADETEAAAPAAETEADEEEAAAPAAETEADDAETAALAAETEAENIDYYETESETEPVPEPKYDVNDYLVIEDDEYKDITIKMVPVQQVTQEEIDSEIEDAFYYLDDYEDLFVKKTSGTVKDGDLVNIDYVGTKDGEEFEGGSAEDYDLEIGSGSFIDGFEEGLIGEEIGSELDLNLTFPEDYGVDELNGEDVVFHVTINHVAEIPELTGEIVEKLSDGKYDNVDDYVESVRSELQANYENEYRNQAYNEIVEVLMEKYSVEEYPEENVQYYVDQVMTEYIEPYAAMYGMGTDDFISAAYGMDKDTFLNEMLIPDAKNNLAARMILTAIAEKEGITMDDDTLNERLQGYADSYGVTVEELTEGMDMETLRSDERQQLVLEMLYDSATIVEVEETEALEEYGSETEAEVTAETEAEAAAETEAEVTAETEAEVTADTEAEVTAETEAEAAETEAEE